MPKAPSKELGLRYLAAGGDWYHGNLARWIGGTELSPKEHHFRVIDLESDRDILVNCWPCPEDPATRGSWIEALPEKCSISIKTETGWGGCHIGWRVAGGWARVHADTLAEAIVLALEKIKGYHHDS